MSPRTCVSLLAACLAVLIEAKDSAVVRRATVDAAGEVRQTIYLGRSSEQVSIGVDAEGALVDLASETDRKNDASDVGQDDQDDSAFVLRARGNKTHRNLLPVSQHAGNLVQQVPDDRVPCDTPPPLRNRHKICQHKECGLPPNAYMVGIKNENTVMESFSSEEDAHMYAYWPGDVTRTELDMHMVPVSDHCVCEGCDEWSEWAIKELATPHSCKFPSHEWRLVWSDENPETTRQQIVKFKVGRLLQIRNYISHNMAYGEQLTKATFTTSRDYKYVAEAETPTTWADAHTIDRALDVEQGKKLAVFQFVLKCKLYNKLDMYINVAEFRTPHLIHKDELEQPNCDPNEDRGFQMCHKMASEENINAQRGRSGQVNPTHEDVHSGDAHWGSQ